MKKAINRISDLFDDFISPREYRDFVEYVIKKEGNRFVVIALLSAIGSALLTAALVILINYFVL